jgi:HlyD family secretion protein
VIWEATAVVAVPSSAVFRHHGGWAVYRLAEGAARLQPITPGHRNTETTEVREGVEPGAQVVLYPGDRLAEGRRIARR